METSAAWIGFVGAFIGQPSLPRCSGFYPEERGLKDINWLHLKTFRSSSMPTRLAKLDFL
jgi:hypothetical protein